MRHPEVQPHRGQRRDQPQRAEHEGVEEQRPGQQHHEQEPGGHVLHHREVLEPAQPQVGVERLPAGVAALAGPHQVDGAVVPLHLLGVQGAQGVHAAHVGTGPGGDLGEVARGLDLQREERVLDLGVAHPGGALVAVAHHVAQRLGGEDGELPAEHRHVAALEEVLHVERRELGALPGDQELLHPAVQRAVVDGVDRGDAADPVVAGDLVDQVLDRVRLGRGVAVDAEQVVHVLDQGVAVVERPDLLVGVLADVVDVDRGVLLTAGGHPRVRTGVVAGDLDRLVGGVVDDQVDDVGQAGLLEQRVQHTGDRLGLVVGGDDAADGGTVGRDGVQAVHEVVGVGLHPRVGPAHVVGHGRGVRGGRPRLRLAVEPGVVAHSSLPWLAPCRRLTTSLGSRPQDRALWRLKISSGLPVDEC